LVNEIALTSEEQTQLKGQEINYQIEAIQLNRIDEQSLEESSMSAPPSN